MRGLISASERGIDIMQGMVSCDASVIYCGEKGGENFVRVFSRVSCNLARAVAHLLSNSNSKNMQKHSTK